MRKTYGNRIKAKYLFLRLVMKYVMVTHWNKHWDKLPQNRTYYAPGMFKQGMSGEKLEEKTPTTFIKLDRITRRPERAWEGYVHNITQQEGGKIYFMVALASEIEVPEKYIAYIEGWYLETDTVVTQPRRQLAEFLPDYFYKTEKGTWRPPASEEEERIKAEGRAKGTGRRIKRYLALLVQGAVISDHERPNDATLAEWIRHCKRSGLYEQGKLLYEKGGLNLDNLSEEAMVDVEEDYQICVRMLERTKSTSGRPTKRT